MLSYKKARLSNAALRRVNLQEADLTDADLYWTDFQGADLRGADLRGASLQQAKLSNVDLRGAKFNVNLQEVGSVFNAKFSPDALPWLVIRHNWAEERHYVQILSD